jgi:uncharacterized protein with PIN domain
MHAMTPKFAADMMVGKLARWMSLLGYDVIYFRHIDDDKLARIARENGRIILTRDHHFLQYPDCQTFLLETTDFWEQLHTVCSRFPLDFATTLFSRCSYCNVAIQPVEKQAVEHLLPPLVREGQDKIYQCPQCQKLYWEATHVAHVKKLLKEHLGIDTNV